MTDKTSIVAAVKATLKDLVIKDELIISIGVKEESINHRFAVYFETHFPNQANDVQNLNYDVEYDKDYFGTKELFEANDERIGFRPDLIVHQRMTNNNIIAFELKKGKPLAKDLRTVNGLLKEPFHYEYTAICSYLPEKRYFEFKLFYLDNGNVVVDELEFNKDDLFHE